MTFRSKAFFALLVGGWKVFGLVSSAETTGQDQVLSDVLPHQKAPSPAKTAAAKDIPRPTLTFRRLEEEGDDYYYDDGETWAPTITAWPTLTPYPTINEESYFDGGFAPGGATDPPPVPAPVDTPPTPYQDPVPGYPNPAGFPVTTTNPVPGYPTNPYPVPAPVPGYPNPAGTPATTYPVPGYPANPYPTTPANPYPTPANPHPVPATPYGGGPVDPSPVGDDDFVPTMSPGPTIADGPDNSLPAPSPSYPSWSYTPEPTTKYVPPKDDIAKTDDEVAKEWADKSNLEKAEAEWEEIRRDKNVKIVSIVFGVTGFLLLLFVSSQLLDNPNGCCGTLCRCMLVCTRILCFPLRALCCCCSSSSSRAKDRRTHQLMDSEYTHDLELT
jgi:hypothetical protein